MAELNAFFVCSADYIIQALPYCLRIHQIWIRSRLDQDRARCQTEFAIFTS